MRMEYGLRMILAIVCGLPGCCCPMNCAPLYCVPQPCFTEILQDNCCQVSEWMQDQSCCLQHRVACQMHRMRASLTPAPGDCRKDSRFCEPAIGGKVPDAGHREMLARHKRQRCPHCKQSPCRCEYEEIGDGFEAIDAMPPPIAGDEYGSSQYGSSQYDPSQYGSSQYDSQYQWESGAEGGAPQESLPPSRSYDEPNPVPPEPTNPSSGPTPIPQGPPTAIPPRDSAASRRRSPALRGNFAVPAQPASTLEQVTYRNPASPPRSDGWKPVPLLRQRTR